MLQQLITDNIDLWTTAETPRSSSGRGSKSKIELTGIKKLRELILELAVRGLLVPQDPNDEPASVLLEKIAAEKEALIKDKKIKKPKPLPAITNDEKSFELPDTWEWVRMGDVVDIVRGITFPASEKSKTAENGRVACLRTTNVQNEIEWEDMLFIREQYVSREEQYIKKSDIVMSMANSRELVGKVAIVNDEPTDRTSFGGFLSVLRPRLVNPIYLMALLRVPTNKSILIGSASQTTNIANISLGKLNPLILALPPLAEQHRIVAKVDKLMALCDQLEQQQLEHSDTHHTLVTSLLDSLCQAADNKHFQITWSQLAANFDTLFTTESSIDQLKQTLLQLAVMGKLVPQDPNAEPASVLLEKIAAEKEALIKAGKIKKQKLLPEITEDEKTFELPNGWELVRLNNAIDVRDGTHDSPKDSNDADSYPLVTSKNFSNGEIDFENARRISAIDHLEISKRSLVEVEDILFSMIGGNIGNQVMVKDERPFSVKNVALFKYYDKQSTSPYFIKNYIENLAFNLQSQASGGAQPFVSLGVLRGLIIALPPIAEQHRIVAKVDELMALCDQLKARLNQAQTTQQQLAHAIVEQAVM